MALRLSILLVALVSVTFVGGCGYRVVGAQGLYRTDIKTVAIPTVGNATFYRDDSASLTGALVRSLEAKTPYRVTDASDADTLLEVTITDAGRRTQSRNLTTGLPDQQLYVVVVDYTWTDLRTGETLVTRQQVEQVAELYPTLGEGQFIAGQSAAEDLAIGIVEDLAAAW